MTYLGSTYGTAKTAVKTQLDARSGLDNVTVLDSPPVDAFSLTGPDGSGRSIWLADAEGQSEPTQLCGVGRLDLDETYQLLIVLQALPGDGEGQATTDLRVDNMLGELLTEIAGDPTWGLTQFVQFETSSGGWQRYVGPVGERNIRPSRCEFKLDVKARISFTGSP